MKKILFLCFAFCCFNIINAQNTDADIKEIKNLYYKLKEEMKAASTAESPSYYVVKTEENTLKKSMPAVGDYYGTTEYWYIDNEEEGQSGTDGILVYKKSDFQISNRKEFREYAFSDGKLIFCFIKTASAEYRYYFKNDKLISFADKAGEEDYDFYKKEDAQYLLENAKK